LSDEFQPTIFKDAVTKARSTFGNVWEMEMDETLSHLFPDSESLHRAVEGYEKFCLEIMRLQIDFERTGVYAPQTYSEAEAAVYSNTEYMTGTYLPGLLLAWYLWPHHYRQIQFFKTFVREMARGGAQLFHDVAPGTGIYSRLALKGAQESVGMGFDISPASCTFTDNHMRAFHLGTRYRICLQNPLEDTPEPVDWLICVELLEHMEDPMSLLRTLRKMLRPGGKAFIATAINAPNSDHIYLYRTVDEVGVQLRGAGFQVERAEFNAAFPGLTPPMVAAFVVS
jgi:2-polyprenyl-3-methyl-5-hydroxy-6-metoxy-1,4-benzoquinol methylase